MTTRHLASRGLPGRGSGQGNVGRDGSPLLNMHAYLPVYQLYDDIGPARGRTYKAGTEVAKALVVRGRLVVTGPRHKAVESAIEHIRPRASRQREVDLKAFLSSLSGKKLYNPCCTSLAGSFFLAGRWHEASPSCE